MLADVESAQPTVHSNRLIAFLDVLGFSSRLDRDGLARVYAEYAPLVDHVQHDMVVQEQSIPQGNRYSAWDPRGNVRNFELARFIFDSLVLVSLPTDDVSNICKFVIALTLLMAESLNAGFPIRGAISCGDVLDDQSRGILLSNAFARLYRAEQNQRWAGCYVMREAEPFVVPGVFGERGIADPLTAAWALLPFAVPHKDSGPASGTRWCLNWVYLNDTDLTDLALTRLNEEKRRATEAFVRHVRALPDPAPALTPEYRPAEYLRVVVTRGGARIKPVDARGNGVTPGRDDYGVEFHERPDDV